MDGSQTRAHAEHSADETPGEFTRDPKCHEKEDRWLEKGTGNPETPEMGRGGPERVIGAGIRSELQAQRRQS